MKKRGILYRIWRIPLRFALIIGAPVLLLPAWMLFEAYLEYSRYAHAVFRPPPLTMDLLHVFLHDSIVRARIRLESPSPDHAEDLREFHVRISPENLSQLNAELPASGRQYVGGELEVEGEVYRAKFRYRGDTQPHWLYRQKSFRVKLKKSDQFEGARRFNLINFFRMAPFIECVAQDLARAADLLAPRCYPVRVFLNNQYHGLYLYYDQIDEAFLRRHDRMPGSIYRGDINYDEEKQVSGIPADPATGVSRLWRNPDLWEKDASRSAELEADRSEIELLLASVENQSLVDFYRFCRQYLDNERHASFLALNMVTGSPHHDFAHNHKLLFDPYKGRFEAISWDDKGFYGIDDVDPTLNPLANSWRLIPQFELMKQQRLWELLRGAGSRDRLWQRLSDYDRETREALRADIHRDAPHTGVIFSHLSRPYTFDQYLRDLEKLKKIIDERDTLLRSYLAKSPLTAGWSQTDAMGRIDLVAGGPVGRLLRGLTFEGGTGELVLYQDRNRNGVLDAADPKLAASTFVEARAELAVEEMLLPGKRRSLQGRSRAFFGLYRYISSPLVYTYFFTLGGGRLEGIEISSENVVTGETLAASSAEAARLPTVTSVSLHPWDLPPPPEPEVVELGPGKIVIDTTREFPEHVEVHIRRGTEIRLAEGVSLFFRGKVLARGTAEEPIRVVADDPQRPWGVFVIRGERASGSVLEHCEFRDGSTDARHLVRYSGMISIYELNDFELRHCLIGRNHVGDDALHFAYSAGVVEDCTFLGARADAFDADISTVTVRRCEFIANGNDALDFMTSKATVVDSIFRRAADKGISVGERSQVTISGSLFENCRIGLEVKDESVVEFGDNVIRGSEIAINLYRKNFRYGTGGRLKASELYIVDSQQEVEVDRYSEAVFRTVIRDLDTARQQELLGRAEGLQ